MVDFSQPIDDNCAPPPNGWAASSEPKPDQDAFAALGEALFATIPRELTAQVARAIRELLAAIKAVLQWLIDRLGVSVVSADRPPVRDIPLS